MAAGIRFRSCPETGRFSVPGARAQPKTITPPRSRKYCHISSSLILFPAISTWRSRRRPVPVATYTSRRSSTRTSPGGGSPGLPFLSRPSVPAGVAPERTPSPLPPAPDGGPAACPGKASGVPAAAGAVSSAAPPSAGGVATGSGRPHQISIFVPSGRKVKAPG